MGSISVRELSRNTSGVIQDVAMTGRPALVTKRGKVVVAVVPVDEHALEDFILANAPEFVRSMRVADRDLAEGKTVDAFEFLKEIEDEQSARRSGRTGETRPARSSKAQRGRSQAGSARARSSR